MKIKRYVMALAAAAGLFSACQKLDEVQTYDPSQVVAPELHALPAEIVITEENMGQTVLFAWTGADFGVQTQINYSIEASYHDGPFVTLFSGISTTSSEQSYEAINSKLVLSIEEGGLGVPADKPSEVDYYISATIGTGYETYYSAPVTVRMTVTKAERKLPQIWVIGDYCGWGFDAAQGLFSFLDGSKTYEGIVDFGEKAANGFKLSISKGWDDNGNWGLEEDSPSQEPNELQLINSGGSKDIKAYSKRFYRFSFDSGTLVLSKKQSFGQLGVVGDGVGSWDNDLVMNFDPVKQRFWADAELVAGEIKFRLDAAWDTSYGSKTEGKLDGSDNIKVPAGKFRIYVNLNNAADQTYELNAEDYGKGGDEPKPDERADWYIHGQTLATPDWGETPLTSASSNIKAYKAAGIEVGAGSQFLFKSGDGSQWIGADKTAAGSDPFICQIGAAFKISGDKVNAEITNAGTYDYWLLPEAGRAYVMTAGEKPEYVVDTWGLVGTLTGWGDLGDFAMSESNGYLVRKGLDIKTTDSFKIRFNNEWNDAKNYGTESGGAVDINKAVSVITSGGSQNIAIQLDGTYDVYFDLTNSKVYIMTAGKTPADAK